MHSSQFPSGRVRRPLLAVACGLLCAMPAAARERPATAPAALFLQATIDAALPLAMPPVTLANDARLGGIMDAALDFPGLAHFALGRYGPELDGAATARVRAAIGDQLRALAYRAGAAYPTLTVTVTGLRIDADGIRRIPSLARLPHTGDVAVEWSLRSDGDGYRVTDVRAFGLTLRHFLRDWITVLVAGRDPKVIFGPPGAASPQ